MEKSEFSARPSSERFGLHMIETIHDGKYVELTYKVIDRKSGHVLTTVEFPLGYVHGHNEILSTFVHTQLEGRSAGEVIEGRSTASILPGTSRSFLRMPRTFRGIAESAPPTSWRTTREPTLYCYADRRQDTTVDGNNPLCGREVVFTLEIVTVREPTDEETRAGGAIAAQADIDPSLMRPV
jgi:FKBP-type peptidyl-prolyl cis-trans isomerase SlyD